MADLSPFLRVDDVARLLCICKREVWRRTASEPEFPQKHKLSTRRTVWMRDEVMEFVEKTKKEASLA